MPIPDYQTVMLPLLRFASTRKSYRLSEAVEALAEEFKLTPDERVALLPAGTQRIFTSRVSWAGTYLKKALLLTTVERATASITDRGRQLLKENPPRIDNNLLRRYAEFTGFEGKKESTPTLTTESEVESSLDPQEAFNQNYLSIRQALADDLLETLKRTTPSFFEKLVVDLLIAMGYGGSDEELRSKLVKGPGDGGVDGIIKQDRLGLELIYVQAKRFKEQRVSRKELQSFVGCTEMGYVRKGVFITTSFFADTVWDYVKYLADKKVILIDGKRLVELMLEYGLGVKVTQSYQLFDIDTDYYEFEGAVS